MIMSASAVFLAHESSMQAIVYGNERKDALAQSPWHGCNIENLTLRTHAWCRLVGSTDKGQLMTKKMTMIERDGEVRGMLASARQTVSLGQCKCTE